MQISQKKECKRSQRSFYKVKKERSVRVADGLSYISANTFGAFSSITTRGLLFIQSRRFITILVPILVSATVPFFFQYTFLYIYLYIYWKKNGTFCVLLQKNKTFSRSFTFFAKERYVLCVLLRSLQKNVAFFAFFSVL